MRLKVSGLPAGEPADPGDLAAFAQRAYRERAPWNPQRGDEAPVNVESGIENGTVTGDVTFSIRSAQTPRNMKLTGIPVPGTLDYVEFSQYGRRLPRPDTDAERKLFCAAGGLMVGILERKGVRVGAHLSCVGLIRDRLFDGREIDPDVLRTLRDLEFPVLDEERGMQMIQRILREKTSGNSVGGQIECAVTGLPAGMGGTWFSALQGRLASGALAVPGVNGVEFGTGFAGASLRGSQTVDPILPGPDGPVLAGNLAGGILSGKTTGLPLIFRVSVGPAPAIVQETDSVDWQKNEAVVLMGRFDENDRSRGRHEEPSRELREDAGREGRHSRQDRETWEDRDEYLDIRTGKTVRILETGEPEDPCAALAALPCVESVAACVLLDELMKEEGVRHGAI